jgi:hypothetical protein
MTLPLPSMLRLMPRPVTCRVKAKEVNCAPWSVLTMPGLSTEHACCSASRQKETSRLLDSSHESTKRLCQSRNAAARLGYARPRANGARV